MDRIPMTFQLYQAAREGNIQRLLAAIGNHNPLNIVSQLNSTLLHLAADFGQDDLVRYLLARFPSLLNRENNNGDTALHVAARVGYLNVVRILLNDNGGDLEGNVVLPRVINKQGNTPLHEAMIHDHQNVVNYFLGLNLGGTTFYLKNNEEKSPLYLAVEAGNVNNVQMLLNNGIAQLAPVVFHETLRTGKSVIHAAIAHKNLVLLEAIAMASPTLVHFKDESQQHSLHCAAATNFLEGVNYLMNRPLEMDIFAKDADGLCPLHLASKMGHVNVIQRLLQYYPDPREFLNKKDQNILHVAAENGRDNVVNYILRSPGAEWLINAKDKDGNTSLHLATKDSHPKVVSSLTWDNRVNLKLVNNEGLTALEVSETRMGVMAQFRERLTWMALMSAGAPRSRVQDTATINRLKSANYEPYNMEYCKDRVNTLLLVSTLVATVTFAAGFTLPGGNHTTKENEGMANMLHKLNFHVFVVCNSIAMYSSIIVVVTLMWAQLGDLNLLLNALRSAQRLQGVSLTMMTIAFMVSTHLVLNKLYWLGIVVLIMGIISVSILLALFIPLFLPYTSTTRIFRYISHYPFYLLMMASESYA